ncbi:polysaccharide lyase family 8 super-sandwich domain-containing protein [Pinibacter aurantiacus]|uniref:Chondroitin sulfate ABC lyase n=1 Tax=Pinibacter aurantiacus TaxID=2851599 RepID=A0A9E2SBC7_9BACT|nr:polysaccharide lyase family 8 super-sandwich domain-containing protein [Pinibacter aurantiacus]MBV4358192.1 hypothetical protein [Pinibacter aurantiacus]
MRMKSGGLTIFMVVAALVGSGQQKFYDFNTVVPGNFSTSGTPLSLSNEHVKDGANGLKWQVKNGTVLTAGNLGISDNETGSSDASAARFFIYSKEVTNDTLVFRFYDKAGALKREGHMLLNYKGWRDYHRSYRYDYNGDKELQGFALDKMEIVYKPEHPSATTTLYLDAFTIAGNAERRIPGLHMLPDVAVLPKEWEDPFRDFLNKPDMPVQHATELELSDAQKVALIYKRDIPKVAPEKVTAAKKFVNDCSIRRNADGSITGRGMANLNRQDSFMLVSQYCSFLAEAAINNNDADAKEKLLTFTEYLLDQGLAEGGNIYLGNTGYDHSRSFLGSFLEGMQLYPHDMKVEVIKMLKWANSYNDIYSTKLIPITDHMYLYTGFLFELAALDASQDEYVRDLKCISRYLSLYSEATPGAADGMKPDGCYSHHGVPYIGYMHALRAFADRVYSLKGTSFRITPKGFQNMSKGYRALFLQSSKGVFLANASSGRGSFINCPLSPTILEELVEVGGDIEGKPYNADLAAFYNYIFQTDKYPQSKIDFDGYYQFNYAQTGVLHKNGWTVVMKGLTDRMWGSEIFPNLNRYGRYQSYGALEVLYNGDRAASGCVKDGKGWDWNVAPGATTVHLPYNELQAKTVRADEYQKNSFAGALTLGKYGIFALDFAEDARDSYEPNNLKFHKSVFAFNNVLVCLGTGISSTNQTGITATNLFQTVSEISTPAIYVNDNEIKDADYNRVVSAREKGAWVLNGPGTGYYVPKGTGDITIIGGKQTVPVGSSLTGSPTVTSNVCKAYISHGMAPANANYRFVVIPGTTAKQMEDYAKQFEKETLFTVLSQTDSLHAVKWLPDNTIVYAFFEKNQHVNIGVVKSISGKALLGVTENKDYLVVTIDNPDLNSVSAGDSYTHIKWRSTEQKVKLQLKGNLKVADNPSNALVSSDGQSTTVEFSLIDGNSATIKLEKK